MVTVAIKTDASNISSIIAKNIRIRKESRLIIMPKFEVNILN
jgi:hypothetical protein